jgi:hypothetical protein
VVTPPRAFDARSILSLQRSAGNASVAALLQGSHRTAQRQDPASSSGQSGQTGKSAPTLVLPREPWLVPPDPLPYLNRDIPLAEDRMDWGSFEMEFHRRNLTLGEGDRAVLRAHWKNWYPLIARGFEDPASKMNHSMLTSIKWSLKGDYSNWFESVSILDQKSGISTSIWMFKTYSFGDAPKLKSKSSKSKSKSAWDYIKEFLVDP